MTRDEVRLARHVVKLFAGQVRRAADAHSSASSPDAERWSWCGEQLATYPDCRPVRLLAVGLGLPTAAAVARVPAVELAIWAWLFLQFMPGPEDDEAESSNARNLTRAAQ